MIERISIAVLLLLMVSGCETIFPRGDSKCLCRAVSGGNVSCIERKYCYRGHSFGSEDGECEGECT